VRVEAPSLAHRLMFSRREARVALITWADKGGGDVILKARVARQVMDVCCVLVDDESLCARNRLAACEGRLECISVNAREHSAEGAGLVD
jgi:hypothetical protein